MHIRRTATAKAAKNCHSNASKAKHQKLPKLGELERKVLFYRFATANGSVVLVFRQIELSTFE